MSPGNLNHQRAKGSSYDRRARKRWLLRTFGDGESAPCAHCREPLAFETVEADRIIPGGSYARSNIQPACRRCNVQRGNDASWSPPIQVHAFAA